MLLPLLELICNTENAVDELINVVGKAAIEAVLLLSAQQIAGPKQARQVQRPDHLAANTPPNYDRDNLLLCSNLQKESYTAV